MASVNLGRVVGYSAYEIAVQNGFEGTEAEWLASLHGEDGSDASVDLTGYATESWVQSQGYLTQHQDISGLATTSALTAGLAEKQDTLTAGSNITIENNVISASGVSDPIELTSEHAEGEEYYVTGVGNDGVYNDRYDGTHTAPQYSAWLDLDGVGVSEHTFDEREDAVASTTQAKLEPTGIEFNDGEASLIYNGRDLMWNRTVLATVDDIPTYTAGDGIEIDRDTIHVLVDGTSIDFDGDNQLCIGSDVATKNYVDRGLNAKQDTLTAGTNITIENNVISSSGSSVSMESNALVSWNGNKASNVMGISSYDETSEISWTQSATDFAGDVYTITSNDSNFSGYSSSFQYAYITLTDSSSNEKPLYFYINRTELDGGSFSASYGESATLASSYDSVNDEWTFEITYADWEGYTGVSADIRFAYYTGEEVLSGQLSSNLIPVDGTTIVNNGGVISAASSGSSLRVIALKSSSMSDEDLTYLANLYASGMTYMLTEPAIFYNHTYGRPAQLTYLSRDTKKMVFSSIDYNINYNRYDIYKVTVYMTNDGQVGNIEVPYLTSPITYTASTGITISGRNISTKFPEASTSTDGTFALKATVSGGSVTYSWVAE